MLRVIEFFFGIADTYFHFTDPGQILTTDWLLSIKMYFNLYFLKGGDEGPDPVGSVDFPMIFGFPDPLLFSSDPDPTCKKK